MRLVVDASVLVAEVLRARGRALLAHPHLDLILAADTLHETEHELHKRVALLVQHGHLEAEPAERLLNEALATIAARVTLVPPDAYAEHMEEARRRIPGDPRDAPAVALALTLGLDQRRHLC
jgi:predicted nucleic acid-binding protein